MVFLRSREPQLSHQGKPLKVWLKGFDAAQMSTDYAAAQEAVKAMGTNAVPVLISYLRRKDPPFFEKWVNLKGRFQLFGNEVVFATDWKRRAAHGCAGRVGRGGVSSADGSDEWPGGGIGCGEWSIANDAEERAGVDEYSGDRE